MAGKIWSAGSGISSSPSMQVPGLSGIELINDGSGLKSGGALWGWGIVRSSSSYSYSFTDLTPVQVPLSGVTAFSDGPDFGIGLLSDGSVMSWGRNDQGQLGSGSASISGSDEPLGPGEFRCDQCCYCSAIPNDNFVTSSQLTSVQNQSSSMVAGL